MLACKAIAYSEPSAGGASGVYFAKLIERMGLAEAMKAKTKYPPAGGFSAALLLTGEAELAVQQKPELLHVKGCEIVGFCPAISIWSRISQPALWRATGMLRPGRR